MQPPDRVLTERTCWYTGIRLFKKTKSDRKSKFKGEDLQIRSTEHVLNKCSPLYKYVSMVNFGNNLKLNTVPASRYINNSITSLTVPMKFDLKAMLSDKLSESMFEDRELDQEEIEIVVSEFFKALNKIHKKYDHMKRVADTNIFMSQKDIVIWDYAEIRKKIPQLIFDKIPPEFFVSEV